MREELGHLVVSDQPMGMLSGISFGWALGHAQAGSGHARVRVTGIPVAMTNVAK